MVYICVICTLNRPPLLPLAIEHRQLLEAIVSPVINMDGLRACRLLLCMECQVKMLSIHQFQKTARTGVTNLMYLFSKLNSAESIAPAGYETIVIEDEKPPVIKVEPEMTEVHQPSSAQPLLATKKEEKVEGDKDTAQDIKDEKPPVIKVESEMTEGHQPSSAQPLLATKKEEKIEGDKDTAQDLKPRIDDLDLKSESDPSEARLQTECDYDSTSSEDYFEVPVEQPTTSYTPANRVRKLAGRAKAASEAKQRSTVARKRALRRRNRKKAPRVKCTHCDKTLSNTWVLRAHFSRKHAEVSPTKCDVCGTECRNQEVLRHHKYSHKSDATNDAIRPELYCLECSAQFPSRSAFEAHRLSLKHTPRELYNFECQVCKKRYPKERVLREHMEVVHLGVRKYKCKLCDKSYALATGLRVHINSVHEKRIRINKYVCDLCGKAFKVKKSLTEHLLTHQGLRPYECKLCQATFSYSAALYNHNRIKHLNKKRKKKKATEELTED